MAGIAGSQAFGLLFRPVKITRILGSDFLFSEGFGTRQMDSDQSSPFISFALVHTNTTAGVKRGKEDEFLQFFPRHTATN